MINCRHFWRNPISKMFMGEITRNRIFIKALTQGKKKTEKWLAVQCNILDPFVRNLWKQSYITTPVNESDPFYHIYLSWFSWKWSKKNIFFFEKKIQNGRLKKSSFFKIPNSQNFFVKISQIGPWVSRIAWCEGHWSGSTYMVVRLSDISSKTAKKHKKSIFSLF